jgi:lactate dehydrogenase-like 2-hydroxyacid dehydrogenase
LKKQIGAGKIGQIAAKILRQGFGMRVICYDVYPNKAVMEEELGCQYVGTLRYVCQKSFTKEPYLTQ